MATGEKPPLLPFAHAVDLVQAHQKDEECRSRLRKQVCEAVEEVAGHRRAAPLQPVASAVADCIYAWTTAPGRTLGEEYSELLPVRPSGLEEPSRQRRLLAAALAVLPLAALQRLSVRRGGAAARLAELVAPVLRAHLALFYLTGTFRRLSDRLAGLRFVSLAVRPIGRGYWPLGALLLLQLFGQAMAWYLARRRARQPDTGVVAATAAAVPATKGVCGDPDRQPMCHICMCPTECATATPCGHLFCWDCIASWCAVKASCPLCRTAALPQHLLPLRHYEVPPPGEKR